MGALEKLSRLGRQWLGNYRLDDPHTSASRVRVCRYEEIEPRQLMTADLHVGVTEYDPRSGLDTVPNIFEVQFEGGATGTQLTHLRIDGNKSGGPLVAGDVIFNTAQGPPGVYGSSPLNIVSSPGFEVTDSQVVNGGTSLDLYFRGFQAGMKLVFTVDMDSVDSVTGTVLTDATVNGYEFQGSSLHADFAAPHYTDTSASSVFWDIYDSNFAAADQASGTHLDLPPDHYAGYTDPASDQWVYSAGAVNVAPQPPLPDSISGVVYYDPDYNNHQEPGEPGIGGATLSLYQFNGTQYVATGATVVTDANGSYRFDHLPPGQYRVVETQPSGYLAVGAEAGNVNGDVRGVVTSPNILSDITLLGGEDSVQNDFAEALPNSISGHVGNDVTGDCEKNPDTPPIAGVIIHLLDVSGKSIATTVTDANGNYTFNNLGPGTYGVHEDQPLGYLEEDSDVGSVGGVSSAIDTITKVVLTSDLHGVHYNFCNVLPVGISGRVRIDTNGDCETNPNLPGVAGVVIHLLDSTGNSIATTTTDANGNYAFDNLAPGTYGVHEDQPVGYLEEDSDVGSVGGVSSAIDTITRVVLTSGVHGIDYSFCVVPPASISGYVFQDGPPIVLQNSNDVPNVKALRDGKLTPDDKLLPGVTLELRDGVTGQPILGSAALPGFYPANAPITTVTDASGHYEFQGLAPGVYGVFDIKPAGYLTGIDTPGSLGGVVVSTLVATDPAVLQQLVAKPTDDAIVGIALVADSDSTNNNFSVVATTGGVPFFVFPQPPASSLLNSPLPVVPSIVPPVQPLAQFPFLVAPVITRAGGAMYTWHLSVVDAGQPRTLDADAVALTSVRPEDLAWDNGDLTEGEWILSSVGRGNKRAAARKLFGMRGAIPVTGDFNGDGKTDLGVFKQGQWFIDLNGNGIWDEGDLWAKLGRKGDRPVTGDWDGDGKTDIGIFGPAWPRDPRAIKNEPGLPDPHNENKSVHKNIPRPQELTALGNRTMKLTSTGKPRADLIDHVFLYGTAGDYPAVGDWNGDGTHTIAVFRNGVWRRDTDGDGRWSKADAAATFGKPGDVPVVGDFNGDGIDDLGVYRSGTWYVDTNGNGAIDAQDQVFQLGGPGDVPVVGDWDGDGKSEPGVYHDTSAPLARVPAE